jgi:hypothetical protein
MVVYLLQMHICCNISTSYYKRKVIKCECLRSTLLVNKPKGINGYKYYLEW